MGNTNINTITNRHVPDSYATIDYSRWTKWCIQSLSAAPTGATNLVVITFTVPIGGTATIFARINCASANDDSFYVSVDGGAYTMLNGLPTGGRVWTSFASQNLTTGAHTLTVGYREDGAQLDKIHVSDYPFAPSPGSMGPNAAILCP